MLAAPTGFGGDDRPITLPERTLGDLLNETFVIYGKNVWVVMGIAALVQAPVAMVALLLGRGSVDPTAAFFVEFILQFFTGFYVYGALAFAAGQQYVTGEMGIGMSYSRVWWRIVSLSALSLIVLAAFTLGALLFFLVVPVVLSLVFMVYWSVSVPAMVVQRMSAMDALRTSFRLVKGSGWAGHRRAHDRGRSAVLGGQCPGGARRTGYAGRPDVEAGRHSGGRRGGPGPGDSRYFALLRSESEEGGIRPLLAVQ